MKNVNFLIACILFFHCFSSFSQIQVDKQIQLISTGDNARITGIDSVGGNIKDAVNVESIQNGKLIYAMAGGSANTITVALNPPVSAYEAGMVIHFISNQTITGASMLNVNGLGPISIKK